MSASERHHEQHLRLDGGSSTRIDASVLQPRTIGISMDYEF
jgi:hypothetical protein